MWLDYEKREDKVEAVAEIGKKEKLFQINRRTQSS